MVENMIPEEELVTFWFEKTDDVNRDMFMKYTVYPDKDNPEVLSSLTIKQGLASTYHSFPENIKVETTKAYLIKEFLNCYIDIDSWTNLGIKI